MKKVLLVLLLAGFALVSPKANATPTSLECDYYSAGIVGLDIKDRIVEVGMNCVNQYPDGTYSASEYMVFWVPIVWWVSVGVGIGQDGDGVGPAPELS